MLEEKLDAVRCPCCQYGNVSAGAGLNQAQITIPSSRLEFDCTKSMSSVATSAAPRDEMHDSAWTEDLEDMSRWPTKCGGRCSDCGELIDQRSGFLDHTTGSPSSGPLTSSAILQHRPQRDPRNSRSCCITAGRPGAEEQMIKVVLVRTRAGFQKAHVGVSCCPEPMTAYKGSISPACTTLSSGRLRRSGDRRGRPSGAELAPGFRGVHRCAWDLSCGVDITIASCLRRRRGTRGEAWC
jgi:hypothetical protein